jgi:formylglycine-generating enzyme required for sulfatase activity
MNDSKKPAKQGTKIFKAIIIAALCNIAFIGHAQLLPEMIKVEGGSYNMGDVLNLGAPNEQPVHRVKVNSFCIAATETTVLQWKTFCEATGHPMPGQTLEGGYLDDHPIVNISYDDIQSYCEWLSDKMGKVCRLPTEAEWEFAARGGLKGKGCKFCGGQTIDLVAWHEGNCKGSQQCAAKKPNELGVYDMSGNACEWCSDWFAPYNAEDNNDNPKGPAMGKTKVVRGGGWFSKANNCRTTTRSFSLPDNANSGIGFRVACSQ